MKKLITVEEVRRIKGGGGRNMIYVDSNTLITPGAKDLASELGMEIIYNCKEDNPEINAKNQTANNDVERMVREKLQGVTVSDDIVSRIVNEVIKALAAANMAAAGIVKECDPSGIRLVRGKSVTIERFDTGVASDKVGIKEVLNVRECPNLATGFMDIEKSSFDWTLGYDEIDYIIEGELDITVNGNTYKGHVGDVFFIPMNTTITFSSPGYCKFFFTAYPANWRELSGKK